MTFEGITEQIKSQNGEIIIEENHESSPKSITIHVKDMISCFQLLYANDQLFFDMLSCITGVDNGKEANTMEVIYNFYSIPFDHHLMVKVNLERGKPEIPSVAHIWKTANWLERETYDMFGINFTNHPDLRRILLPADWQGHPLLKDYEEQETYRGIRVAYGESDSPNDIPT